jgi:hypothetical protein
MSGYIWLTSDVIDTHSHTVVLMLCLQVFAAGVYGYFKVELNVTFPYSCCNRKET